MRHVSLMLLDYTKRNQLCDAKCWEIIKWSNHCLGIILKFWSIFWMIDNFFVLVHWDVAVMFATHNMTIIIWRKLPKVSNSNYNPNASKTLNKFLQFGWYWETPTHQESFICKPFQRANLTSEHINDILKHWQMAPVTPHMDIIPSWLL